MNFRMVSPTFYLDLWGPKMSLIQRVLGYHSKELASTISDVSSHGLNLLRIECLEKLLIIIINLTFGDLNNQIINFAGKSNSSEFYI